MRISQLAAHKAKTLLFECKRKAPAAEPDRLDPRPEMLCFRGQNLALVRHFFELSSQVGRVSSLLGREFFRSRVSHHAIPSFEEQAVFVRDVELCFLRLKDDQAEIVTLVGLYDFSYDEVSQMLSCSRSMVHMWFCEALDTLSEIFMRAGLLREDRPDRRQHQSMNGGLAADIVGSRRKPPASVKVDVQNPGTMRRSEAGKFRGEPQLA
jgi:hypothetical protein